MTSSKISSRINWIDVCKGIAIICIFLGHWTTPTNRVKVFVYCFHLQLFFIVSGFFALKQQSKKPIDFLKNQCKHLFIPLIFFNILNIIYFDIVLDKANYQIAEDFFTIFTDFKKGNSQQLWFLAALFAVSIAYYFLLKLFKKQYVVLIVSYILYIIQVCWQNTFLGGIVIKCFVYYVGIQCIPTYLLWYSVGAYIFSYVIRITKYLDGEMCNKKKLINIIGTGGLVFSWCVFSFGIDFFNKNPEKWNKLFTLMKNKFIYENYKLGIALCICVSIMFLSYIFQKSVWLTNLGRNTMILMGMETIGKNFLFSNILTLFNLKLAVVTTDIQIIGCSIITLLFISLFFKFFNNNIPFLIGKG